MVLVINCRRNRLWNSAPQYSATLTERPCKSMNTNSLLYCYIHRHRLRCTVALCQELTVREIHIYKFMANFTFHYLHVTYCLTSVRTTVEYSPRFTSVQLSNFHVPHAALESAIPVSELSEFYLLVCTVHLWRLKHFIIQQVHKYIIRRYN